MKLRPVIISSFILFLSLILLVQASTTLGIIDPNNNGSFKALIENNDLGSANTINFGKFTNQPLKNITVSSSELRGFAWGNGVGWMVTNCADTNNGCNSTNGEFKIKNDGSGKLSGYAWGENMGWINFGPFTNPNISTVKIDNGKFGGTLSSAGYAWSQNFGWIKFDCSSSASCVETDWRPSTNNGGGNGGVIGGGGNNNGGSNTVGEICPNTVNYESTPLSSSSPFTVTIPNPGSLGFAIKTFWSTNPATPDGNFATENSLNAASVDQVSVYNPQPNKYLLAFEDMTYGDFDYNDLVVEVDLSCPGGGICPLPNSLSDTNVETINNSPAGEQNLQTILNATGYSLDKTINQKQYQRWESPSGTTITAQVKFINRFAGKSFIFGYYTGGTLSTFVPIFKTSSVLTSLTPIPPLCIPDPSDYCPNISGNQTELPPGKVLNTLGQCVDIVADFCPNIAGAQTSFPSTMMYDRYGDCVPLNSNDYCPNMPGVQRSVPSGMTVDGQGNCVTLITQPPIDVCLDNPVACKPPLDACALNPTSCHPNEDTCLKNPQACQNSGENNSGGNSGNNQDSNPIPGTTTDNNPDTTDSCEQNPSLCTPTPDACQTDPSLCTPNSDYCLTYPELCQLREPLGQGGNKIKGGIFDQNLSDISNSIRDGLIDFRKTFPAFFTSSVTGKIIAASGLIAVSVATALPYMPNGFGMSDVFLNLARYWSVLLTFFGLRKKSKPWGTVYDSVTKQPIDPAYVVLYDLNGEEVATSITDMEGRYGFTPPPGIYTIVANKTNFAFPSVKLAGRTHDELYTDLYFGERIMVNEDNQIIAKNIPLDQLNFDWNEYAKNAQSRFVHFNRRNLIIARILNLIFTLGFTITIISFIIDPTFFNGTLIALYILISLVKVNFNPKLVRGSVKEAASGLPLSFAIIRIYSTITNKEVTHKVSDQNGDYYALVANGVYRIVVDIKNIDGSYSSHPISELIKVTKGILNKKFRI